MSHPDSILVSPDGPQERLRSDRYNYAGIDRYAHSHLNSQFSALNAALVEASRNCQSHGFPDWGSISSQGKFFMVQCQLLGVRRVLEIGTFGGHGAIWCAAAHPELRITTVEASERHAAVAQENLDTAGISGRVELIRGDAENVLSQLLSEVANEQRERYGLVIVDVESMADTWTYVDKCVDVCVGRACIIAHTQVRKSNLSVDAGAERREKVKGSRELIENMGRDKRMTGVLLMNMGEQNYDMVLAAVRDDVL